MAEIWNSDAFLPYDLNLYWTCLTSRLNAPNVVLIDTLLDASAELAAHTGTGEFVVGGGDAVLTII
jgi:hypothetical protein